MTDPKRTRDVSIRTASDQTPRERAEFLAHEITNDVMAPAAELADAIEVEILRFCGTAGPSAHPDDEAVDRFAIAMKEKLARKRDAGRCGWEDCSMIRLADMLVDHLDKGDPVDVANFAMMLFHREGVRSGNKNRALTASMRDYRERIVDEFMTRVFEKTRDHMMATFRKHVKTVRRIIRD